MSFLRFFRKKENPTADSGAGFVPLTATSDFDTSDVNAPSHGGADAGNATTTESGASFFGGDGGGASGGDGGGGGS